MTTQYEYSLLNFIYFMQIYVKGILGITLKLNEYLVLYETLVESSKCLTNLFDFSFYNL